MSKIRDLIEKAKKEVKSRDNYDNSGGMFSCHDTHDIDIREVINIIDKLEQAIKAEIMGLQPIKYLGHGSTSANGKYNKNLHPMTLVSAEAQHIDRSDLENLFKESE